MKRVLKSIGMGFGLSFLITAVLDLFGLSHDGNAEAIVFYGLGVLNSLGFLAASVKPRQ